MTEWGHNEQQAHDKMLPTTIQKKKHRDKQYYCDLCVCSKKIHVKEHFQQQEDYLLDSSPTPNLDKENITTEINRK